MESSAIRTITVTVNSSFVMSVVVSVSQQFWWFGGLHAKGQVCSSHVMKPHSFVLRFELVLQPWPRLTPLVGMPFSRYVLNRLRSAA